MNTSPLVSAPTPHPRPWWNTGWGGRCRGRRWCWWPWAGRSSVPGHPARLQASCWRRSSTSPVLGSGAVDRQQRAAGSKAKTRPLSTVQKGAGAAAGQSLRARLQAALFRRQISSSSRRLAANNRMREEAWLPSTDPEAHRSGPTQHRARAILGPARRAPDSARPGDTFKPQQQFHRAPREVLTGRARAAATP